MHPQIEFKHVLGELSVNRNDPCEVVRELVSNSYDAGAKHVLYIPIKDRNGLAFLDDGSGLDSKTKINGITPWEAFFSIGKSTKLKGNSIGYKCQGSKLCFASSRILVITTQKFSMKEWDYKLIDNPRSNLDTSFIIDPTRTDEIDPIIDNFFSQSNAETLQAAEFLKKQIGTLKSETATLILIDGLDTESYNKYFAIGDRPEESYVVNYIRFFTKHGDIREITANQGFTASQRKQISSAHRVEFNAYYEGKTYSIPFGYPYLDFVADPGIKSPAQVARLRDGRFASRSAKSFQVKTEKFSIIVAIDGNRRAHDEYWTLDRKGKSVSGIRLADQRGVFISVKGIKICRYQDLLTNIPGYEVLSEGDSPSHYTIVVDGDFDLVTNRSALSKKAYDTLSDPDFLAEVKKYLDSLKNTDPTFAELLTRLKRESTESLLNEQIEFLDKAKSEIKSRERFRIADSNKITHLFLSPRPGEEYWVGVLYAQLATLTPKEAGYEKYWRRIITFSTQGIDSLGLKDEKEKNLLEDSNVCSIEYKYEFNNTGPFNHALAVVDYIVAWNVDVDVKKQVKDSYTCYGDIVKIPNNDFEWKIENIESTDGAQYPNETIVIDLKKLILATFNTSFSTPPKN
ncbi:ATP-binding protein [Xenophilus aerolatus]|nr:ATP-binding protein [Xenophilus aerolatus]